MTVGEVCFFRDNTIDEVNKANNYFFPNLAGTAIGGLVFP